MDILDLRPQQLNSSASRPCIVWFRQDLRLEDNPAFDAALKKSSSILPVYIYAPEEEGDWPSGGASRWWLYHSLQSLSDELSHLGLKLIIRKGNSQQILDDITQSTGTTHVFWNRRYEPAAIKRDIVIKEHLHSQNIEAKSFNGSLLFEPWTIANKQSKPFQVFTPFWKACLAMPEPEEPIVLPPVKKLKTVPIESLPLEDLTTSPKIHWDKGIAAAWSPGAPSAKKILSEFIKSHINQYKDRRDRPDLPGVSRISPYLHFGEIVLEPFGTWLKNKLIFKMKVWSVICASWDGANLPIICFIIFPKHLSNL